MRKEREEKEQKEKEEKEKKEKEKEKEKEVGEAIKESGIPREELFLTSKNWLNCGVYLIS